MKRKALHVVLCAALMLGAAGFEANAQQPPNSVRPEVGKPLQAAQAFVKQRKGREAMAEIAKAEAVPNRTPYENQIIAQMKAAAATVAGDPDAVIRSNEALLNSGKVSGREAATLMQAIAVAYYNKKDYAEAAKWTQRYFKEGGNDPQMRTVLLQSYYLGNDCNAVNRMLAGAIEGEKRASEDELGILANCYLRNRDTGGYVRTIEQLVIHYPKKQYWTDLLSRVQKKPGFSDRLGLDVYRLRMATGNLAEGNDYFEAAQLALQAGVPAEAKIFLDKGYEVKLLGQGKEGERHARLRALIDKSLAESQQNRAKDEQEAAAAKDGNDLVKIGQNYVYEGKADKGISLMEQGIKKGGLKRPDDAKLRLGEAQIYAGRKNAGVATLKDVKGTDGTADIARLWILNARA